MTGHSVNGPSSFARRIACPGSANAERGIEDVTSVYAAEGTAAHELAQHCLTRNVSASDMIGKTFNGFTVDDEMAAYVQEYVDYCKTLKRGSTVYAVERRFNLPFIGDDTSGTADFVCIKDDILYVADFKYGRGVPVEVKGNVQGLCYGLGAARRYKDHDWTMMVIVIVQPRAFHKDGVIRTWDVPREEADDYALEFAVAAEATKEEDAPRKVGDHCRFCKASPTCPTQRDFAAKAAGIEFGDTTILPARVEDITPSEMVDLIFNKFPVIEQWINKVKEEGKHLAEQGKPLPNTKLVATKAMRYFTSEGDAIKLLTDVYKLKPEALYTHKFKSVAQIEKVVGKKNMEELNNFVESKSTGVTLVAMSDSRKAARVSGTDDFGAV